MILGLTFSHFLELVPYWSYIKIRIEAMELQIAIVRRIRLRLRLGVLKKQQRPIEHWECTRGTRFES